MNKIFYSALLLVCCTLGFVSCDDDVDNPYEHTSSISIVSSNLSFNARADRGVVKFSAPGTVTARTTADWCTASVDGDSVVVSVTQNPTISGRSAQLVLSYGGETEALSIIQRGVVVQLETKGIAVQTDEASTHKYSIVSNVDLSVAETPDWATATIEGDSIVLSVTANTTGSPRIDYVTVVSGDFSDSIKIVQADFDKDVAGTYRLHYTMANGRERSANVTLSDGLLSFTTLDIPITFDPYTASFTIQCGQYVGRSETMDYVYLVFGTSPDESGMTYWSSYLDSYRVTAPMEVAADGSLSARFFGTIGGYEVERFMFRNFSFGNDASDQSKWSESERETGIPDLSEHRDLGTNMMEMYTPYLTREAVANPASTYVLR